jgi:hypothetical protein
MRLRHSEILGAAVRTTGHEPARSATTHGNGRTVFHPSFFDSSRAAAEFCSDTFGWRTVAHGPGGLPSPRCPLRLRPAPAAGVGAGAAAVPGIATGMLALPAMPTSQGLPPLPACAGDPLPAPAPADGLPPAPVIGAPRIVTVGRGVARPPPRWAPCRPRAPTPPALLPSSKKTGSDDERPFAQPRDGARPFGATAPRSLRSLDRGIARDRTRTPRTPESDPAWALTQIVSWPERSR